MSYLTPKTASDFEFHNYKASCASVDRVKYGKDVLAKLQKIQEKIISMKAVQEDVTEMEADYLAVESKVNELKFSTHQGWLKLNKAIECRFQEIALKDKARKTS